MKTIKQEVSNSFAELRNYGYKVWNFSTDKRLNAGMSGFVDMVVGSKRSGRIVFIEFKFGKDKFSNEQDETRSLIEAIQEKTKCVHYLCLNENNYLEGKAFILSM